MDKIRVANKEDLIQIETWLKEEVEYSNGFYHNFGIIENYFKKQLLFVYEENNSILGFITGSIKSPSIINVRKTFKGKGIGKKLYYYLENKSRENNVCLIDIICEPTTSIPFWKKMGFRIIETNNINQYTRAFKILDYNLEVPIGDKIEVEIYSFDSETIYDKNISPKDIIKIKGVVKDNIIYFNKRLIFPTYGFGEYKEITLKIIVNNKQIFFDKTKRPKAKELGIEKNNCSYYIDKLKFLIV